MKKVLLIVLAMTLAIALVAACAPEAAPAPAAPAPADPAAPAPADPAPAAPEDVSDEQFTIGVVLGIMGNDFHSQMRVEVDRAIAEAATRYPNITIEAVNPTTPDEQLNQVETFLNQGVDLLVMMPQDAALVAPLAQQAYESGVPTVIINRRLPDGIPYTKFIVGENVPGGRMAAEYIVDFINENLGGQADVVAINMGSGMPIAQDRQEGFMSVAAGNPAINLLGPEEGYESAPNRDAGLETMQTVLIAHPHIDIVFTHDDETALGVLTAIHEAGRTDIQVVTGFGFTLDAMRIYLGEDVMPGQDLLRGTALYPPSMGYDAIWLAIDVLLGRGNHPQDTIVPGAFVTRDNVHEFYAHAY
ncbi:MAG: substrate-binding domain-containing protein [Oscillospiraceae bacterium]|nr:substrate-binding domain-containing protein [Oscillospiraceae bacterium]